MRGVFLPAIFFPHFSSDLPPSPFPDYCYVATWSAAWVWGGRMDTICFRAKESWKVGRELAYWTTASGVPNQNFQEGCLRSSDDDLFPSASASLPPLWWLHIQRPPTKVLSLSNLVCPLTKVLSLSDLVRNLCFDLLWTHGSYWVLDVVDLTTIYWICCSPLLASILECIGPYLLSMTVHNYCLMRFWDFFLDCYLNLCIYNFCRLLMQMCSLIKVSLP